MPQIIYSNHSGHLIEPTDSQPITIYTDSEVDHLSPGQTFTDSDGNSFLLVELRHVSGRLYRVVMLPVTS